MMNLEAIENELAQVLKKGRFKHTIGVMYTAGSIAMRYDEDIQTAMLAGLLHDCGKYCSEEEQIALCKEYGIELTEHELEVPALIHAKLGAYLAKEKYHAEDDAVYQAILYHTTGRPDMTMLEKIIYLADYIEPYRKQIPGLDEIRKMTFIDINEAVRLCAENTLKYLKYSGRPVDPMTQYTYEFYTKNNEVIK